MFGQVELPITKWYLTIPIQVREQFLDGEQETAECQLIGDALQIVITEGDSDLVVRAELEEWETGKPRERKMNNGSGIYIDRWRDQLKIIDGEDDQYVPAEVGTTQGDSGDPLQGDNSNITFYRAEELVEEYIRENKERRTTVRSTDIVRASDVDRNQHNLTRIHHALEAKCEVASEGSSKAKKFKMPGSE